MHGRLLDAGCGKMPYKEHILSYSSVSEYTGLDIENALEYDADIKPDFYWNGVEMPFEDESFDSCLATEVLEHCFEPQILIDESYRILAKGGYLFFTIPFVWPLHEVPYDAHRYTPWGIQHYLNKAGFSKVVIMPSGGWHAFLGQSLGLWFKRSALPNSYLRLLGPLIKPIMLQLFKMDKKLNVDFKEGQMITSILGYAIK